jgi:hypothetical protein
MSEQEPPYAQVTPEHRWLQQLEGTWKFVGECKTPEGSATQEGTQTVRRFGELWTLFEADTQMGPEAVKSVITLGFDPAKGKFVGSFVATMMSSFWVYEGTLDAGKKVLPLNSEGPRMDGKPGTAQYQDEIEIVSKDEYIFRARLQQDDGKWIEFMTSRYTRTS